jgi:hypothetical protein
MTDSLLWTRTCATAFAFRTSFGRFLAAEINLALGALVVQMGTLGKPAALTAIAFG